MNKYVGGLVNFHFFLRGLSGYRTTYRVHICMCLKGLITTMFGSFELLYMYVKVNGPVGTIPS